MARRRVLGRSLTLLACVSVLAGTVSAAHAQGVTDNQRTLVVSLPGPFNGCGYLDAGATPTSVAIGDLLLPSAFYTRPDGSLAGAGESIASAELVSLNPESVVYTVAPKQRWSNGKAFTASDLVSWWQRARSLASVYSDGYRDIKSMSLSANGLSVTAVFSKPDSYWNQLFRDVEAPGGPTGCAISNLMVRPSLGPYVVRSASATRVVLTMNPHWPSDTARYGRVVLESNAAAPASSSVLFAGYTTSVTKDTLQVLSGRPWISSHLGSLASIEEVSFSPLGATRRILLRQALSWMIDRQGLINRVFGSVTFSPSVATSALYSQGQSGYPGGSGSGPSGQTPVTSTTTSLPPVGSKVLGDCPACVAPTLSAAGYHLVGKKWVDARGRALTVSVLVGPSALDRNSANIVAANLRSNGVSVSVSMASSEQAVAIGVSKGRANVGVFARPTGSAATHTARSFTGPAYPNTFPSGVSLPFAAVLYSRALATFNPVTAEGAWRQFDRLTLESYWVRPLFTPPSLVIWNNRVAGVNGALSVPGFLDQLSGWNTVTTPSGS